MAAIIIDPRDQDVEAILQRRRRVYSRRWLVYLSVVAAANAEEESAPVYPYILTEDGRIIQSEDGKGLVIELADPYADVIQNLPLWWDADAKSDPDDLVLGRVLAWAHQAGLINLIGASLDVTYADGAPMLDGFLASEGVTGIPIAVPKTAHATAENSQYAATVRSRTSSFVDGSRVYRDAVVEMRTSFAALPGRGDILSGGFGVNLQEFMNSPADGISGLTGKQLIATKVRRLIWMGGVYPTGTAEHNFAYDAASRAAAADVAANWPGQIFYSGFEVGQPVITGGNLKGRQATDVLAQALLSAGRADGRESWDPITGLLAIAQDPFRAGFDLVRGGNVVDASTGVNVFTPNAGGKDYYLVKAREKADYESLINQLLDRDNWATDFNPFL